MFVKAPTLPEITLPETVNIQSSMNKFEFDFLESMEFRCHFNFCVGQVYSTKESTSHCPSRHIVMVAHQSLKLTGTFWTQETANQSYA